MTPPTEMRLPRRRQVALVAAHLDVIDVEGLTPGREECESESEEAFQRARWHCIAEAT